MAWYRPRFRLKQMMVAVALAAVTAVLVAQFIEMQEHKVGGLRLHCRNNLAQIGLGLHNYHSAFGTFPYGSVPNDRLPPDRRLSWFTGMFGYFTQLFLIFDMAGPWDEGANLDPKYDAHHMEEGPPQLRSVGPIDFLTCPANPVRGAEGRPSPTSYVGIAGLGADAPSLPEGDPRAGIFGYDRQTTLAEIKDGASFTMAVIETMDRNGPWTAGGHATVRGVDPAKQPYLGRDRQFGGAHGQDGGAMVLFADGSVRFLAATTSPRTFEALATIAGGETVPGDHGR